MNYKNIKAVALDLDDTTLNSDSTLADETRAALSDTVKAGIEVIVASGRSFNSLPKAVLGIEGINYAITGNGSAIVEVKTGERIFSRTIRADAAAEILDTFPDAIIECFVEGQAYSTPDYMADPVKFGCSEAYVSYVQTSRKPVSDMRAFIKEHASELDCIDIVCPTPDIKAATYARAKMIENVYVTSSSPRLVEFASCDAGKGTALRHLCRTLGIEAEGVAAFGNGDNDADMLIFAGLGVAVANGTEYCRRSADLVCEANDDLGVAKTLRKILE